MASNPSMSTTFKLFSELDTFTSAIINRGNDLTDWICKDVKTTTTATPTTTTTIATTAKTTSGSCKTPPPMKYVIGLDASKSMTSDGWAAAVRFANAIIDYSLQGDSEVLLYYFNGLFVCCLHVRKCVCGELDGDCTLSVFLYYRHYR